MVKEDITNHLLDDEDLAYSLNAVCEGGMKHISDGEGGSLEVPDYHLRLKAIKMSLQLKGHFREKKVKSELVDAIYTMK